ncbi:hypothetical protein JYU34_011431 [Plutella xylostella]|uniref:Lipid-binding serum glycoprotein N-terminal domain-containing protein n=1 Tax=Plutella xylostella TaxID=51655 RepID=A0ABQ7QGZ8_PLUXY|nr:hypothetical protein JYU34_011431 [Plutella xylostella]
MELSQGNITTDTNEHNMTSTLATSTDANQILVDLLVKQFINLVRRFIVNGSETFNIRPMDPLQLEQFQIEIPSDSIWLFMEIEKGNVTGLGGFVVNTSHLQLSSLTLDLDVSLPQIHVKAGKNLKALKFFVSEFGVSARVHLKRSDDGRSIVIDWLEDAQFSLPSIKSDLNGVVGGGGVVNAIVSQGLVTHARRLRGALGRLTALALPQIQLAGLALSHLLSF